MKTRSSTRPDYARIAQLERELGMVPPPVPAVCAVKDCAGHTEIRVWGYAYPIRIIHD